MLDEVQFGHRVTGYGQARASGHDVLALTGRTGVCRWQCSFDREGTSNRVLLDGILVARFDRTDHCSEFRKWWHSSEAAAGGRRRP